MANSANTTVVHENTIILPTDVSTGARNSGKAVNDKYAKHNVSSFLSNLAELKRFWGNSMRVISTQNSQTMATQGIKRHNRWCSLQMVQLCARGCAAIEQIELQRFGRHYRCSVSALACLRNTKGATMLTQKMTYSRYASQERLNRINGLKLPVR
jgi:hypothetical protein